MSLLFFVNTDKIRNYSYIKGRSQCSFTSHETLWNNFSFNFSFKWRNASDAWHLIWGRVSCLSFARTTTTTFFYYKWASEPSDFLSELTEEWNMSTTFSFLMQLVVHIIMVVLLLEDAHGYWEIVLPFFKNQDFSFLI